MRQASPETNVLSGRETRDSTVMAQGRHWPKRRWALMAGIVYALAVTVRLVFLLQASDHPLYQCVTVDERTHHDVARAIADGTLPPTGYVRAPLYDYFLGVVYKIAGPESLRARFVQVFVASFCPVLLLLIGGRLFSPSVGLLAGVLGSVFWTFVFFSTELLDTTLTCALYLLLAYLLIALDDTRWWKWVVCGLAMGLGAITRPNILAFAPVLVLVVVLTARSRIRARSARAGPPVWLPSALSRILLFAVGSALAIAPVAIRNRVVANERLWIAAYGAGTFWVSNSSWSDERTMSLPELDGSSAYLEAEVRQDPWFRWNTISRTCYLYAAEQLGRRPTYQEAAEFHKRLAIDYVRRYPGKLLTDMFKRFCHLFDAFEYPCNKDIYEFHRFSPLLQMLSWLHFGVIAPLGVLGFVMAVGRRRWPAHLAYYVAMLLSLSLPATLFPITARYRLPFAHLLVPLAAYAVLELVRSLTAAIAWRRVAMMGGALAGLFAFSNANLFGYRPAAQEGLLVHYAAACLASGRHDLVAQTSDEIERVLADPSRAACIATGPLEEFFKYFHDRGDVPRAARYAREMMRRGAQVDPRVLGGMMKIFVRAGWRDEAERALSALQRAAAGRPSPYLAAAMLRYGRAYRDGAALASAAELYAALVRLYPDQDKLRERLTAARQALADLQTQPSSNAAGSRPSR